MKKKILFVLRVIDVIFRSDAAFITFRKERDGSWKIEEQATLSIQRKL